MKPRPYPPSRPFCVVVVFDRAGRMRYEVRERVDADIRHVAAAGFADRAAAEADAKRRNGVSRRRRGIQGKH